MSFSNSGDAYKASKETPSRGEVSGQQHDGYEDLLLNELANLGISNESKGATRSGDNFSRPHSTMPPNSYRSNIPRSRSSEDAALYSRRGGLHSGARPVYSMYSRDQSTPTSSFELNAPEPYPLQYGTRAPAPMQGGPSSGFGIDKSWSADQSVAPVDPSQQDIQRMIALGQAQYVMIPGVGLVLVPIMQAPTASMNVMPPYHQYGAGTTYPTAPPRTLSTQSSSIKGGFKNKVATLATMVHQSADDMVYLVQFKYLQRNYILSSEAPKNICVGEFIVVEADRGEDIGIVVEKAPASFFQKDKHTAGHRWKAFATGQNGEIRKVTRIATLPERALLPDKAAEEASITEACRERAVHQYHMPIAIIDTEFQLDRHKLTIYYEAERRIDFREFVRELFSLYKTRIWMAQIESSFEPNEDAAVALRTGNYPPFAEFEDGGAGRIINISDYILRGSVSNMRSSDTSDSFYQIWPFEEQQPNTRRL